MSTGQRVGTIAVAVVVSLSSLAAAQIKKEFKYTVGPGASVTINNEYGPVIVKPSNNNQVIVVATSQSDKVEVDETRNGDRVQLKSHLLPGATPANRSVDYQVQVPADTVLTIHSTNGPLHAEQLHGDVTVEGDSAPVEIREINNAHVHVNTLNGPITLANIRFGHVEVNSIGGDISLVSVTGPLISVTSTTGKISYNGDFGIGGDYKMSTHTGNIEAVVPADASVDVTARSVRGDVENDFPLHPKTHTTFLPQKGRSFVGTAGQAASSVLLRTFSGKIRLKKSQ
jgi:DUF4097 and DUF4098 domain-containing protein YvlB